MSDLTVDYKGWHGDPEGHRKAALRGKASGRRKELEGKMTPEQLKKLKIHYGMGVSGEIGRHERNPQGKLKGKLQKEIILLKAKKIKELILTEDDYAMAHFGRRTSYPTYQEYLKKEKKRLGLDLIPVISREDTVQECVSAKMSKMYHEGEDKKLTREQMLGKAFGICRGKKDFTEDYPVQSHTRGGKPVKAHTRGEGKPKFQSERSLGNYAKSKRFPGKFIRIVRGKVYIEYKPFSHQQGRGTAKAIRVGGVWIPKSQVWYDTFGKGGDIYVSEWFYPKLERKEAEAALESVERELTDDREEIERLHKMNEEIKTNRFNTLKEGHYDKRIEDYERYLEGALKEREEIIKWFRDNPKEDFVLTPIITSVIRRTDSISFSKFTQLKTDFENSDFVIFHGPIARDGPYDYMDENGKITTLYKDIDNLRDIYSRYKYLPMKTSEELGTHYAEEFGYATNFSVNEKTNEIEADLVLVNDDNFKKILGKKESYHVSPGYNDIIRGNIQMLTDVDHIALALGDEIGRACTGTNSKGASCTKVIKTHDQNLTEVINN